MKKKCQQLVGLLRKARGFLALPENDFMWSPWKDGAAALGEVDGFISRIESGDMPQRPDIEVLFDLTGPIQEVGMSSGWGMSFLKLASRFDAAVEKAFTADTPVPAASSKKPPAPRP
jgi:hypothetical protein